MDFIERAFGISPDGCSGATELMCFAVSLIIIVVVTRHGRVRAFLAKMLIVRAKGFPGWALPIAGVVLFSILVGLWLTSAFWFFSTFGIGL